MALKQVLWRAFLGFLCVLCVSCVSTSVPSGFRAAKSLSEIQGKWVSSNGELEYPLALEGKKYLRYALVPSDDTAKWFEYADTNGIDVSELWKKRFVLAPYIYQKSGGSIENFPYADENGTQIGRKFFVADEKIFSRVEILIPERLVAINLEFFAIRKDSAALRENGVFYLASDTFRDITADDTLYFKMGENQKAEQKSK